MVRVITNFGFDASSKLCIISISHYYYKRLYNFYIIKNKYVLSKIYHEKFKNISNLNAMCLNV